MLGFNDKSTLVGHFVSPPEKGRKEIEEIVEEMRGMMMMSSGLMMHQPMRVICIKMVN